MQKESLDLKEGLATERNNDSEWDKNTTAYISNHTSFYTQTKSRRGMDGAVKVSKRLGGEGFDK